jgi:hypothetical protein
MAIPAMRMQQMQQWAGEKEKVWRQAQHMPPMLPEQNKRRDQTQRKAKDLPTGKVVKKIHSWELLNLSALAITLTDDSAMAAAAMMGESKRSKNG